jgi:glutathione peroxidase
MLEFEQLPQKPLLAYNICKGVVNMTIHPFVVKDASGQEIALSRFEGKVVLIVNTASRCGYTPQYAGLQRLYNQFHDLGLEILAFPCDQFGHQEPGTDDEIQQFCQLNYGVTFPVFSKIEVNGPAAHPLYHYLTTQKPGSKGSAVQWNFTKFLVNQAGEVVERFEPGVKPEELVPVIDKLLFYPS